MSGVQKRAEYVLEDAAVAVVVRFAGRVDPQACVEGDGAVRAVCPDPDTQPSAVFGASIAGVVVAVVVVIVSVLGVALRQRRRELVLLRMLGGTPGRLGSMVGREAALIAGMAALLGAPLGTRLGHRAINSLSGIGILPTDLVPVGSVAAPVIGTSVVIAIAWATARTWAWFVLRHSPRRSAAQEISGGVPPVQLGTLLEVALACPTGHDRDDEERILGDRFWHFAAHPLWANPERIWGSGPLLDRDIDPRSSC